MRIGPTELGTMINTSKQNVYGIYKRKSIDTQLLAKISLALNHDFFLCYVKELGIETDQVIYQPDEVENSRFCREKLEIVERENEELKKENDYLKKINHLLEERMK